MVAKFTLALAIHLAAVADSVDAHDANLVGNLVIHAAITDTDAPVVFASGQFAPDGWAGFVARD